MQLFSRRMGQGPLVVVLHCALSRSDVFLRLAGHFAQDHEVLLVDLPNHGKSDDWDGVGDVHGRIVDALVAEIDRPAHVIGHSLGATLALRLAVEAPELVNRLSLIEPVYFAAAKGQAGYQDHERVWGPVAQAFMDQDYEAAARKFMDLWGGSMSYDALASAYKSAVLRGMVLVEATTDAIGHDPAGVLDRERLLRLTCPVDLIEGALSPQVIGEIHGALEGLLPNTRRYIIPEAGHMLSLTHTDAVVQAIREGNP